MSIIEFFKRLRRGNAPPTAFAATECVEFEEALVPPVGAEGLGGQDWDRVLSSGAHAWLSALPVGAHPSHLADEFPRLVNRLSLVWRDVELVDMVLDDLLVDRRGGRRGFSPAVSAELLRLQAFHARRPRPAKSPENLTSNNIWDLQVPADR